MSTCFYHDSIGSINRRCPLVCRAAQFAPRLGTGVPDKWWVKACCCLRGVLMPSCQDEADSIDVEMLLLDNEVGYLKSKLMEVCTFDYSAAILPRIRAYIWDKLNNSTGEDSQDGGDKNAVNNGDGLDNLHEQSLFEDKIPDTDSDMRFTISRTDECENSSISQSGKLVDVSAIPVVEMKSLGQLLRDADKQFQFATENCQCGNKTKRSLRSEPPIFAIVFNWPIDKHCRIDMSEVLINITTPLRFDTLYDEVLPPEDYTLATAICCLEEEHLCFARKEEKWIIYGSEAVEFADSWECLLHRYRHRSLRPQILFFDRVGSDSSIH